MQRTRRGSSGLSLRAVELPSPPRYAAAREEPGPWRRELDAIVRAFSGAYLFGIPLLYTMEMWWLGQHSETGRLLVLLAAALVATGALAFTAGFRNENASLFDHLDQAIDALAVGIVGSAVVMLVLNRIRPGDPLESVLGIMVVQSLPLSLGAILANAVFGGRKSRQGDEETPQGRRPLTSIWTPLLRDVGATAIGATFIVASIAPTEEVPMLAASMDFPHMAALVGFSLLMGYAIVFASGWDPETHQEPGGLFQHPFTETMMAYVVSLVVAAVALLLMQKIGPDVPPYYVLQQTLVLGLPAMVGGAAGRLVV